MNGPYDPAPAVQPRRAPVPDPWAEPVAVHEYQTPCGQTILECARCLAGGARDDDERPYRALTIAKGAAVCIRHFNEVFGI